MSIKKVVDHIICVNIVFIALLYLCYNFVMPPPEGATRGLHLYFSPFLVTLGYHRLLQVTTGYYMLLQLLLVTTGYYWLLQVTTVTTGYYRLLQVTTVLAVTTFVTVNEGVSFRRAHVCTLDYRSISMVMSTSMYMALYTVLSVYLLL